MSQESLLLMISNRPDRLPVESVKLDLPPGISENPQSRIAAVEIEEGDSAEPESQTGYSFYLTEDQSS